jgi:hypothetical protein
VSDTSQGEGWWQASDGKWYPPQPQAPAPPPPMGAPGTTAESFQDQNKPATASISAPGLGATSWVVIGGIGGAFVGSFLPWASAGIFTVNGTDGDGVMTLIASAIAGGCYGYHIQDRASRKGVRIAALVLMVITALIYVVDFADISTMVDNDFITVSPGIGLILGTIGSIAAVIALIVEMAKRRPSASEPQGWSPCW